MGLERKKLEIAKDFKEYLVSRVKDDLKGSHYDKIRIGIVTFIEHSWVLFEAGGHKNG